MTIDRREFFTASAAAALASQTACGPTDRAEARSEPIDPIGPDGSIDWAKVRRAFPRAVNETYFNAAAQHPVGIHTRRGIERYIDFMSNGVGEGREDFWETRYREIKPMFAKLINAKPEEIAFCAGTTIGENLIASGMDLKGGNVVTNDLHYGSCLANYLSRQALYGLDVRIVKHRDWQIDYSDMERAVNSQTKLIAVSLVSSNNGHLEDVKKLSELAHAHGAYLFADIIQGCGATPIDVKAMGIDFASCGMYKWLQGEHGFGFLYVKEDLQGSVVKGTQFTGHAGLNYQPWTESPDPDKPEFLYHPRKGISQFECSTPAVINYAGQYESFKFIEKLGVDNIRVHARELTDRLQNELPSGRYTSITPKGTEAAIVVFLCKDSEDIRNRIRRANEEGRTNISIGGSNSGLTVGRNGNQMRFSVSVYNNHEDVDRILEVLS